MSSQETHWSQSDRIASGMAVDIFATANPALGAAVLWAFLNGAQRAVDLPLMFLPLPLLLSSSLASSFEGTNKRTGFYVWLDRTPELTVELPEQVQHTLPLSRQALLYAGHVGLITGNSDGGFIATDLLSATSLRRAGQTIRPIIKNAKQLGKWVADVGSTREIFYALGLTV